MSRRDRNRRKDRLERLDAPPAPSPVRTSAPPPSNRSTFRVAQANRVLASELSAVVHNSTRDRRAHQGASPSALAQSSPVSTPTGATRFARQAAPLAAPSKKVAAAPAATQRRKAKGPMPPQKPPADKKPGLDQPLPKCKSRPGDTRKKAPGSGSGKSFVPWC